MHDATLDLTGTLWITRNGMTFIVVMADVQTSDIATVQCFNVRTLCWSRPWRHSRSWLTYEYRRVA